MFRTRALRRLCFAAMSVAASCVVTPASAASERTAADVEEARQVLASTYFGPPPLFFTGPVGR